MESKSVAELFGIYFSRNCLDSGKNSKAKRLACERFLAFMLPTGKTIGESPLSAITPLDCEDAINSVPTRTSGAGKRQHFAFLASVFNWLAARLRIVSPMKGLQRTPCNARNADYLIDVEELPKLLACLANETQRDLVRILWLTGARPSEIIGATIEEYNGSVITKAKHKTAHKGHSRVIVCNEAARNILAHYIGARTTGLIFLGKSGRALCMKWLTQCLQSAAREIGRTKPICLYSLRHSFACRNLSQVGSAGIHVVACWLGHSVQVCERTYAHTLETMARGKSNFVPC